jgi:hypothetical protein
VTQGGLPQDQEEDEGDRKQQPQHAKQDGHQEAEDEPDHRHKKGDDRGDVHELILQVVAGEELAEPAFEAGTSRRTPTSLR